MGAAAGAVNRGLCGAGRRPHGTVTRISEQAHWHPPRAAGNLPRKMRQIDAPQDPPRRRKRGFEPASGLLAAHIRRAAEGRGIAATRLLTHWPEVVGADTAAICRPVKMAHGKGGMGATLTLLTSGAHAPRLAMMLPLIREQVNACYGWNAVARIAITQTAASGFAPAQAGFAEAQAGFAAAPPTPTPAVVARAEAAAEGIDDPDLAAAMRRLALGFYSRRDASRKGRPQ